MSWTKADGTPVSAPANITEFYKRSDLSHEDLQKWLSEQPMPTPQLKGESLAKIEQARKQHEEMKALINGRQGLNPQPKQVADPVMEAAAQTPGIKVMEYMREQIMSLQQGTIDLNPLDERLKGYVHKVEEVRLSDLEIHGDHEAINITKTRYRAAQGCIGGTIKVILLKITTGVHDFGSQPNVPNSDARKTKADTRKIENMVSVYGVVAGHDGQVPSEGDLVKFYFPDPSVKNVGVWVDIISSLGTTKNPIDAKGSTNGAGGAPLGN
jgi:hypothetical protein